MIVVKIAGLIGDKIDARIGRLIVGRIGESTGN